MNFYRPNTMLLLLPTLCLLLLSFFFVARGEEGMISLDVNLDSFDIDATGPGQCYTLAGTAAERQSNPCSGVVTYSYFVPNGLSPAYFANKARNALNNTLVMTLPSSCSERIVALTCSQIYLKCYDNINLLDPATYNYYPYQTVSWTYPLPFYRPCASLCSEVSTYCANTLFSLVGTLPNCQETYDYSQGNSSSPTQPKRYDTSENSTKCYRPNLVTIAGQQESYLHANDNSFCSGFVDSLFINPGTSLSTNFTVLQLPHVYQTMMHSMLANTTSSIPTNLDVECMTSLRKFLCYQNMPPAQKVTFRTALTWSGRTQAVAQLNVAKPAALNFYIYVPSMPNRSICLDYTNKCAEFIAATTNPNLVPNCTAYVKNRPGVYQFPTVNQTMTTVTTSSFGVISFPSSPYEDTYYNLSEYSYTMSPSLAPTAVPSALPTSNNHDHHRYDDHLSGGDVAALVVVPIVGVTLIACAVYWVLTCMRASAAEKGDAVSQQELKV